MRRHTLHDTTTAIKTANTPRPHGVTPGIGVGVGVGLGVGVGVGVSVGVGVGVGETAGVTTLEGADGSLVPTALVAVTVKVYVVLLVSPSTAEFSVEPSTTAVILPGSDVVV